MRIRITKTQYEILEHRLSIPDCIADAMNCGVFEQNVKEDDVYDSAYKLEEMAKKGSIQWATLTDLDKDVLWDALDGSTFIGSSDGYVSPQQLRGYQRSFGNLVDKLEAAGLPQGTCGFI